MVLGSGVAALRQRFQALPDMFTPISGGIRVVRYAARRAVVRTFTRMALPAGRRNHFCLLALGVPQLVASVASVSWAVSRLAARYVRRRL